MKAIAICLFLNLFVSFALKAQTPSQNLSTKPCVPPSTNTILPSNNSIANPANQSRYSIGQVISPNYYTTTIGFFCKRELQLERTIKLPVKIRLGSVAYTDKMEGKGTEARLPK
jgi:hypothetical protein